MELVATVEAIDSAVFDSLEPPRLRSHLDFAQEELIFADGPRKGLHFNASFMPFTRLILNEYDGDRYRRFFLTGPTQSGKTILGLIEPCMYHLFECAETVILGAPTVELAQTTYEDRILPSIRVSRFADLLPRTGRGSRSGRALEIVFRNGAILRFMGAGGGDQQRSSFTARVVVLTEIDKMDQPGKKSRETDPVSQIESRTDAFGENARIYGECTTSIESGRIYQEVHVKGTGSTPRFPCQSCAAYVPLEREHFTGWQEMPDVMAAREGAHYACPNCSNKWTEEDRAAALRKPLFVEKEQSVEDDGSITGKTAKTNTFGLRWTALATPLRMMADIGEKEWYGDQGTDIAKKGVSQFVWALPYAADVLDLSRIEVRNVLEKIVGHERGAFPPSTVRTTWAIDVGSYVCWWALIAWSKDTAGHVVDFGSIDIPQEGKKANPVAVLAALRAFRDNTIDPGWGGRRPDKIVIDSGYESEVVYAFVQESGQGRYLATKGFGATSRNGPFRTAKVSNAGRQVGNEWILAMQSSGIALFEINSDHWKAKVHSGFAAAQGAPGSLTIHAGSVRDTKMKIFARQICAEYREIDQTPNREAAYRWVVANRQNHYLDVCAMGRAVADMIGIRVVPPPEPRPKTKPSRIERRNGRAMRTKY